MNTSDVLDGGFVQQEGIYSIRYVCNAGIGFEGLLVVAAHVLGSLWRILSIYLGASGGEIGFEKAF